jgi:hypothetical protein
MHERLGIKIGEVMYFLPLTLKMEDLEKEIKILYMGRQEMMEKAKRDICAGRGGWHVTWCKVYGEKECPMTCNYSKCRATKDAQDGLTKFIEKQ